MPRTPAEATGLLALMLLQDARRDARLDERGDIVLLDDQDRGRWNHAQIQEALMLVDEARGAGAGRGSYTIQAAIAAVHCRAATSADTNWPEIVRLYDELERVHPSPVVSLNRAAAVAMADGPEQALSSSTRWRDAASSTITTCCMRPARTCCGGSDDWPRPPGVIVGRSRSSVATASAGFSRAVCAKCNPARRSRRGVHTDEAEDQVGRRAETVPRAFAASVADSARARRRGPDGRRAEAVLVSGNGARASPGLILFVIEFRHGVSRFHADDREHGSRAWSRAGRYGVDPRRRVLHGEHRRERSAVRGCRASRATRCRCIASTSTGSGWTRPR